MQAESVTAVKIFIRWCYQVRLTRETSKTHVRDAYTKQEQLQSIQSDADPKEQNKWKRALIDVWIFAGRYGITKLQNQAMNALISLFDTSHLLTKRDVQYIWQCTSTLTTELRSLAALVLVAQIEDGNEQIKRSLEDIDEMADLEGFTSEIYTALKGWLQFQSPRTPKKDKRTKWAHFTKREEVLYLLMVEVEETPMPEPKSAEKKSCGNERKGPVEVIEID